MRPVLYVCFPDTDSAGDACVALMRDGVDPERVTMLVGGSFARAHADLRREELGVCGIKVLLVESARSRARRGAIAGLRIAAVVAVIAFFTHHSLISFFVDQLAVLVAITLTMATYGAMVGAMSGFFHDIGLPEEMVDVTRDVLRGGGALLAVQCRSVADHDAREDLMWQCGAVNTGSYLEEVLWRRAVPNREHLALGEAHWSPRRSGVQAEMAATS